MIKQDFYGTRPDGVNLYRTYSDDGHRIVQTDTGAIYDEAVDIENSGHVYAESEEMIEDELTDSEALRMLLGGDRFETGTGD